MSTVKDKIIKYAHKEIILPVVLRAVIKVVIAIIAVLLRNRFLGAERLLADGSVVFMAMGVFYIFMGWLGFLRLDGVRVPRIREVRFRRTRADRRDTFSQVLDTEPEDGEDMSLEEKDVAAMVSWLIAGLICVAAGIL